MFAVFWGIVWPVIISFIRPSVRPSVRLSVLSRSFFPKRTEHHHFKASQNGLPALSNLLRLGGEKAVAVLQVLQPAFDSLTV